MKTNEQAVLGTPKVMELSEGRRYRGSLEVMRDTHGNQILVGRIYNRNTRVAKTPEAVTEHGRVEIFPYARKVKFTFEFKDSEPEIADTMMDEASELADWFIAKRGEAKAMAKAG